MTPKIYDADLCDEKHKSIWIAINQNRSDIKEHINDHKKIGKEGRQTVLSLIIALMAVASSLLTVFLKG